MVETNTAPLGTGFHGARSTTARPRPASPPPSAAAPSRRLPIRPATPADFVRPGHLLPLVAKEGGVLRRAGHTEADRRSVPHGRPAARRRAVRNPRRRAATGPTATSCTTIAAKHDLPIISIEQLIAYRRVREKLVYRIAEATLPTASTASSRSSPTA